MVGVDADLLQLSTERVLAVRHGFEVVVGGKVGPAEHATVDDMRQTFALRHLQAAIQ